MSAQRHQNSPYPRAIPNVHKATPYVIRRVTLHLFYPTGEVGGLDLMRRIFGADTV